MSNERYSRQSDLISEEKLKTMKVSVVGVGGIGRNVALQLASIGIQNLQLIDFDEVEESNIASQGYLEKDLGKTKVAALTIACKEINSDISVDPVESRFKKNTKIGEIVFCCVDKMDARKFIFENTLETCSLFIDGRMAAECLQVYTSEDEMSQDYYRESLFSDEEAYQGTCTAKSTIYCGNIAAAVMVSQFTKWLRNFPLDKYINYNIFSNEFEAIY